MAVLRWAVFGDERRGGERGANVYRRADGFYDCGTSQKVDRTAKKGRHIRPVTMPTMVLQAQVCPAQGDGYCQ
jgi:hypothetical protein